VFLRFDLEAIDTPIVVAGMYQDDTNRGPMSARSFRTSPGSGTYRSQVSATTKVGWFRADLFDADFPLVLSCPWRLVGNGSVPSVSTTWAYRIG
jgi:hypothetical protein